METVNYTSRQEMVAALIDARNRNVPVEVVGNGKSLKFPEGIGGVLPEDEVPDPDDALTGVNTTPDVIEEQKPKPPIEPPVEPPVEPPADVVIEQPIANAPGPETAQDPKDQIHGTVDDEPDVVVEPAAAPVEDEDLIGKPAVEEDLIGEPVPAKAPAKKSSRSKKQS